MALSTHLAARLGRHFERGLEGPALLRGQDRPRPLGTLVLLPLIGTLPAAGAHAAVLVLAFHWTAQTQSARGDVTASTCTGCAMNGVRTRLGGRGADGRQHLPLLLVVHAAQQLAFLQHKLITSLQTAFALAAGEAAQVVDLALHAHDELGTADDLQAGAALPHKQPAGAQGDGGGVRVCADEA